MGKRKYKATRIQDVRMDALVVALGEQARVVVAIDVAKEDFFAAVMSEDRSIAVIEPGAQANDALADQHVDPRVRRLVLGTPHLHK